jgi:hypothetical protein
MSGIEVGLSGNAENEVEVVWYEFAESQAQQPTQHGEAHAAPDRDQESANNGHRQSVSPAGFDVWAGILAQVCPDQQAGRKRDRIRRKRVIDWLVAWRCEVFHVA